MKKQILPSLIAKNQKEFDERFEKVKNLSKTFHLDVMDGRFVKNKSLNFDLTPPRKKYQVHLMVNNPEKYAKIIYSKADAIIFHLKATKNPEKLLEFIKSKKRKSGIAINPNTSVKSLTPYLKKVNMVLVMTVNPGKYGAKFLPKTLKKVRQLRKLKPRLKIILDGGINDKTIRRASASGANDFVVGSYLQKSENPRQAISELRKAIKI